MASKDIWDSPYVVDHPFADVAEATTAEVIKAAVPGRKIRVIAFGFVCGAVATDAQFGSDGTAISPNYQNAANGGAVKGWNPAGWFETARGEALTLTTGAGSTTGVLCTTVEI